jgi:hypothetical protein
LVASPVRCSRFALTPLALNLLARDLLPCTRPRLRNQAEPATGKTLPLALANAPNSISLGPPDPVTPSSSPPVVTLSWLVYHRRRSCAARRIRAVLLLLQPPHGRRELAMPGCIVVPSSSSHPVTTFASPPFLPAHHAITTLPPSRGPWSACIRAAPSAAFSSTASVFLHARLYCSSANTSAAAALQLLPHRARPSYT